MTTRTPILTSYGLAVRKGPRPRHVLHVQKNGATKALCGAGPVIFVGEVECLWNGESWPFCDKCEEREPGVFSFWTDVRTGRVTDDA